MIFLEYLRISGTENTAGEQAPGHKGGGRALPPWARPLPRGPMVAPLHLFQHSHTPSSSQKNHQPAQARVLAHLAAILISLLKAPFRKLLWEIVAWYVTPPLIQLVFVLVLYSLQFFAA